MIPQAARYCLCRAAATANTTATPNGTANPTANRTASATHSKETKLDGKRI